MATVEVPADQSPTLLEEAALRLRDARGHGRTLVTGGDPDAVYPVPSAAQFVNELGDPCEYLHAGDLEEIASALLQDDTPELMGARFARIRYLWRREGGSSHGHRRLGRCQRASGLLQYWADCDFIIWLAADHLREFNVTAYQVESLVYHELLHITTDEAGRPAIRGHDWEGFVAEILRYGLCCPDVRRVGEAVQQLRLDLGDGA